MRIATITGGRAEYGLLEPLIKLFEQDPDIDHKLFVTGSHLSPEFGHTVDYINYPVAEKIEIVLSGNTPVSISKAMGLAMISFGEAYERHKPDLVVGLGDRFELMAAVSAAHVAGIPVAHIHGGEITTNAYDDAFRHSITKMSHLHFVATSEYRKRVQQLGEFPRSIFNVGAIGCDGLKKRNKFPYSRYAIYAYYPETLENYSFNKEIKDFIEEQFDSVCLITNGYDVSWLKSKNNGYNRRVFLALLEQADVIIGNSSAGIIEAPALGVPTINIGDRQEGRLMAGSIIQAEANLESVRAAINKLYSDDFQAMMKTDYYKPYGSDGNTAQRIKDIIKREFPKINMKKGFCDSIMVKI